ncbi:negative regulator of beta-lactamase expression [Desulfitobacterium dehalogenans ATCC 51507]|uniref:N-acetylmuramoyl-L-alanine amidase n=1 Tax=Desulfitobacterium dehalogenans (strain ATCC 51507 / DSM 9161 / JW/IU-DC1) TaxID=756499 RepID=I4A744_DESDJ|nr:N-acetylmuramoyl-L-alanine amidase [Desulfitobacterium dehalogenans]AFL99778.1 negative regulator of beta-lactamase expression [Desulfitobacterium dehalogenans ATCC 51507]
MPQIEWVGTPNFRSGRNGRKPLAIVDHITAGYYPSCLSWLQNPESQASAHYLVLRNGRILQLVEDKNTAWHAGIVNQPNWSLYDGTNPNFYTIGIEHEGRPGDGLTEAQYQSTLWFHRELLAKYPAIKIDSDHIIGHYRIDSINRPNCPGTKFPWAKLFADLKGDHEVDNLVIYADGDVGAALLLSFKLKCPMVHKAFADKIQAENKHWIGVQGANSNGNYYYAGSDRVETAKLGL